MKEKKKLEDNHTDEPFITFTIPEPDESVKKDIEKVALLIRQRHRAIFLMKQLGISERVIDLYRKKCGCVISYDYLYRGREFCDKCFFGKK